MKKIDYTFVCIGTNRIISDSFGPRVGKKLKQVFYKNENINVYGTMENPIHLKNVEYFLKKWKIKSNNFNRFCHWKKGRYRKYLCK